MRSSPWRRHANHWFLLPLFAAALFYQIVYSVVVVNLELNGARIVQSPLLLTSDGAVDGLTREADHAGLKRGDRIATVDGNEIKGDRDYYAALRKHRVGERLTVTIARTGEAQTHTFRIPLQARLGGTAGLGAWTITLVITVVLLFCVLVGIYVAAVLPNDARAFFFFGLMVGTPPFLGLAGWYNFPRPLWFFADIFPYAALFSWTIWLVLFGLHFPERFEWDVKRPWIKWIFLSPLAAWAALMTIFFSRAFFDYDALPILDRLSRQPREIVVFTVACTAFFTALGTKQRRAKTTDTRRRLRILYSGSIVSLTPIGGLVIYQVVTNRNPFNAAPEIIIVLIFLLFCLFPVTLAYVIVAERTMALRMVVRQGVRYALARGGLRIILSCIGAAIIFGLNMLIFGPRASLAALSLPWRIAIFVLAIIAISLGIRRTRRHLNVWVDRRFFREAYNAQLLLEDLSESVRSIVDQNELLDTVARRISLSLHVPQFAVLLDSGEGVFRPVYCLGLDPPKALELPGNSKTVEIVNQSKQPPQIYFEREDNWVHSAPEPELITLKALHAQLLLPVGAKKKLMGLLSLGPKLSEEPYSQTDLQLLRSVALHTGLALENSRLTKAVAEEAAKRERLNREIEIAREVQERLFPQRLPVIAGIDYSGACRPALGVGGDYYDFLTLPNGDLGIAIGDVSGKGIAAALLMASLQASLRGQALMGHADLAQLMANVNQLVYDATPINRYATFFYGQYRRESRVFIYVNAGHNAPLVLRHTNDGAVHVIRLDTGGPVVGLFPNAPYQQGSLVMEPGDIFVGFTDGISEAMNKQDEEWGEERLIPAVARNADRSASEMIPALMEEADRFASGAPQHDDMTLVVVKMCETVS